MFWAQLNCVPRYSRERVASSHCSNLHTKDLPKTALPTSSQPESLPYAAKIFSFILYCIADQHPKLLLHSATHTRSCRIKWLATPGHLSVRYHHLLLSSCCLTPIHPFAKVVTHGCEHVTVVGGHWKDLDCQQREYWLDLTLSIGAGKAFGLG